MPKRKAHEAPEPTGEVTRVKFHNLDGVQVARFPCGPDETLTISGSRGKYFITKTCPVDRKSKWVKWDRKMRSVYVYYSDTDGTLKGDCYHCTRGPFDFSHFAPKKNSNNTVGKCTKFHALYKKYKVMDAEGNDEECERLRGLLEQLRTAYCITCRARQKLTPAQLACKECWNGMRQAMAKLNDGCQKKDCPERGPDVWEIIQADHGTNPKVHALSDYAWWAYNGGVPAMIEEAKQIKQWICACCHAVESTSSQGNRCTDPETMPKGRRRGTKNEKEQYDARHRAVRVWPKLQYVDAQKRLVGCCAACKRPVVAGKEVQSEWDHVDEATKCKGGLFRKKGGVAGLVGNVVNAAKLKFDTAGTFVCIEPLYDAARRAKGNPTGRIKKLLDREIKKCNLLCCNCHRRRTHQYGPSPTVF